MKKLLSICLIMASLMTMLSGCAAKEEVLPDIEQIRSICQLATLECHYNNVATGIKEKHAGLAGLFEKERDYWVEYNGIVKLGIDMDKVDISISGNTVTVVIPSAQVMGSDIDTSSFRVVSSEDGFLNKNEITVEDQQKTVAEGQQEMIKTANENDSLLAVAQNRAKTLIKNYIDTMGEIAGKEYTIKWKNAE
ncbi:MAG: DUF4230 domain-containing protein [Clostridia bacterium]|nr:DUF4230 domain-containing protein [Clostridia bacterium]